MRKPESKFKEKFLALARQIPNIWLENVQGAGAIRGVPDVVGCVNGIFVGLELKKDAKDALVKTGRIALQKYTLMKIAKAGGYTALVTPQNSEEILLDLKELTQKKRSLVSSPRCQECGKPLLKEWIESSNQMESFLVEDLWKCSGCACGS